MSSCCITNCTSVAAAHTPATQLENYERQDRNARITAFALSIIAIVFLVGACALFRVGSLPPKALMGLGFMPYLGGIFVSFLSLGVMTTAAVFVGVSAIRSCQRNNLSGNQVNLT